MVVSQWTVSWAREKKILMHIYHGPKLTFNSGFEAKRVEHTVGSSGNVGVSHVQ